MYTNDKPECKTCTFSEIKRIAEYDDLLRRHVDIPHIFCHLEPHKVEVAFEHWCSHYQFEYDNKSKA